MRYLIILDRVTSATLGQSLRSVPAIIQLGLIVDKDYKSQNISKYIEIDATSLFVSTGFNLYFLIFAYPWPCCYGLRCVDIRQKIVADVFLWWRGLRVGNEWLRCCSHGIRHTAMRFIL
ncbi:hypothetical protein HI914_01139 [Erysiphe necator]|nr:hypothetical protein HI914_01139 [Erysiphe necator]